MSTDSIDALESVKKDIKRIRRSGSSAEIFGWALLLFAAAVVWLSGTKAVLFILFGVFTLVGLFFVCSGKYIKDGFGRKTKIALLATSVVAFPLCFGILPIYVYIRSADSYRKFKELPDKIQLLFNKPKPLRIRVLNVIALVCIVIIGAASIVLKLDRIDTAARQISRSSVQSAPKVNTAAKYRFTITFPGSVSEADFTEKVSSHQVSYASFSSTAGKGAGDYKVYAYHFPETYFKYSSMPQADLAAAVHKSLIASVQGLHGVLANSSPSTYTGHASEDAEFTCQTFAGTRTGYIRVFYIDSYEYSVIAIGSSNDDFSNFANSFRFKGI